MWHNWNISSGNKYIPIGGRALTKHLATLLSQNGVSLQTTSELDLVRQIKESSQPFDGKSYDCAEPLFNPSLLGFEHNGLAEAIYDTIMKCDIDLRMELAANILLSGGNTMFPGFAERLERKVAALCPAKMKVNVIAREDRVLMPWVGGSILASLSTFQQRWVTKEEYEELGEHVVNRKRFYTMYDKDRLFW